MLAYDKAIEMTESLTMTFDELAEAKSTLRAKIVEHPNYIGGLQQ